MQEFGGQSKDEEESEDDIAEDSQTESNAPGADKAKAMSQALQRKGAGTGKLEGRLIAKEARRTGSVSWRGKWFRSFFVLHVLTAGSIRRVSQGWKRMVYLAHAAPHPHVGANSLDYEHL